MRIVVLDSFAADQGMVGAWSDLQALGEVALHARTSPSVLAARAADAEVLITNKVVLDGDRLRSLTRLRYVGVTATGVNVVDLPAARERGVAVTNVPGYAAESVAQLTFALILQLALDVSGHSAEVKTGHWAHSQDFCFFLRPLPELAGKTLVVLGMGAIGRAVSRIALGFGMRVVAAAVPGSSSSGRVPLDKALSEANVVSLHCPLTETTARMVDQRFLARLPAGAIVINTSRGSLIDEVALIEALASGRLAGAGLDVLSQEPPPGNHPLTDPDAPWASRLLITPHIGWGTVEARARLRRQTAANLAAFLRGERVNRVD